MDMCGSTVINIELPSRGRPGKIIADSCERLHRIPTCIICLMIICFQDVVLNYYIIRQSKVWYSWIIADSLVLSAFIAAFVWAFKHLTHLHGSKKNNPHYDSKPRPGGELPMGYITWAIYAVVLATKVAIIFGIVTDKLDQKDFFGPNMLKVCIGLTALIYLLVVLTHHDAPHHSDRKHYIDSLTSGVALDILDCIEFMETLFHKDSTLPSNLRTAIIAVSCINLILPTVPLLVLSRTRYGRGDKTQAIKTLHTLLYVLVVNVPFMVLRIIIWHTLHKDISIFLMKNIIMTYRALHEIYENSYHELDKRVLRPQPKVTNDPEHQELSEKMGTDTDIDIDMDLSDNLSNWSKAEEDDAEEEDDLTEL